MWLLHRLIAITEAQGVVRIFRARLARLARMGESLRFVFLKAWVVIVGSVDSRFNFYSYQHVRSCP
jgi:hypothetical protein